MIHARKQQLISIVQIRFLSVHLIFVHWTPCMIKSCKCSFKVRHARLYTMNTSRVENSCEEPMHPTLNEVKVPLECPSAGRAAACVTSRDCNECRQTLDLRTSKQEVPGRERTWCVWEVNYALGLSRWILISFEVIRYCRVNISRLVCAYVWFSVW